MPNETRFDVIVVGAGPGGISAAIWCADLGLKTLLLEELPETGGQLLWTFNAIKNYPAILSIDARELRDRFLEQVANAKVTLITSASVVLADLSRKTLETEKGECFSAGAIILATGVRRRTLNVSGEADFVGRGILSSGVRDQNDVAGLTVAIIGGGDAALENAVLLSRAAREIVVVHRGEELSARSEFVAKAKAAENISFRLSSRVDSIMGKSEVTGINIVDRETGKRSHVLVDKILIRIGVAPNTELFAGQLDLDPKGYIKISADCSTSLPEIYAIGDVANPVSPTITSATGMGATAAKASLLARV